MGKDNGCVGSYSVSGYTRDDGTQVSGYTRICGASHLSSESDVRNSLMQVFLLKQEKNI